MKDRKGFTLVELLAVIALMSIIIVIAVYSIKNTGDEAKEKDYVTKVSLIETSAVFYAQDNITSYPQTVTIQSLLDSEYITPDVEEISNNCGIVGGCLINPVTTESMNALEVIITKANNKISAELQ